jgi:hypothetical protein
MKIVDWLLENQVAGVIGDAIWHVLIVNVCLLLIIFGYADHKDFKI